MSPSTCESERLFLDCDPLNARLTESLPLGSTSAWRAVFGLMLALLFGGLVWVINNPGYVHPDEHFYTDAAIQMVRAGDPWTPLYPDGRPRLEKPILTYWAMASSFDAFGINLFSSRLPSTLAGVLVVGLTFQLARAITDSRPTALVATAIMTGNIALLIISTRATPDIFLCLFTLVSIWGVARVWFQRDQSWIGPLLAFGGMGLAVQTKGLLGLWPLAAIVVFGLMGRPEPGLTKRLLHWPAITIGITLAVFWYAVMFQRHGNAAFRNLYEDQLGSYVTFSPLSILRSAAAYFWGSLINFLPWTLLLLATGFERHAALAAFWQNHRPQMLFALIPFVLLTVAFSFGTIQAQRYLTSALPMLAVLVASVLFHVPIGEAVWKWVQRFGWFIAGLEILGSMGLLLAAGVNGCGLLLAAGLALLAVGIVGVMVLRRDDKLWCWVWIAGLIATTFVVGRSCLQPLSYPPALPSLAKRLLQQNRAGTRVCAWQLRPSRVGLLHLLTEGRFPIGELSAKGKLPDFSDAQLVVTTSPHDSLFREAGYDVAQIETDDRACPPIGHLAQKFWPREFKMQTSARETYWLATRRLRKNE